MKFPFRAVIFDIDGTLLDSNEAHTLAFEQAFREQGFSFSHDAVRRLIGMGTDHLIPELIGKKESSEEGERISKRKKEIFFQKFFSHLKPFPQSRDLIQTLQSKNIQLAIATSAKEDELMAFLEVIGIQELIQKKASSDKAKNSKPEPDIVLAALTQVNVSPPEAVMIGDTPYDIQAAKNAGIASFAFRCGGYWKDSDFQGARAIYDGPGDLLSQLN